MLSPQADSDGAILIPWCSFPSCVQPRQLSCVLCMPTGGRAGGSHPSSARSSDPNPNPNPHHGWAMSTLLSVEEAAEQLASQLRAAVASEPVVAAPVLRLQPASRDSFVLATTTAEEAAREKRVDQLQAEVLSCCHTLNQ